MGLPTLTSTTNYNINLLPNIKPSVATKSYGGDKEKDIDLVVNSCGFVLVILLKGIPLCIYI